MVNYRAAFNSFNLQFISCVISISPYSTRSRFRTSARTPGERKSRCLPAGSTRRVAFINIRRNLINTRQRMQHFHIALALWRSLARRTNCAFTLAYRTGPDALFARGSCTGCLLPHHFFNRAVQTPCDPFFIEHIRMYCGIASASGAMK